MTTRSIATTSTKRLATESTENTKGSLATECTKNTKTFVIFVNFVTFVLSRRLVLFAGTTPALLPAEGLT